MRLSRWRGHLRVVGLAFEMALRSNMTDSFVMFGVLFQPLIMALLAFWMLEDRGNDNIIFVVVGSGMTGLWTTVLFVSGQSINSERWTGTLEMLVAVPAPIQSVIMGKNLANVFQSLASMIVCYGLAGLVFGSLPHIARPGWFALSLLVAVLAYVSTGLIMASLFILNAAFRHFQNSLEFPIYILAGFLFPVALLPGWTTPVSYLIAPYWAARALHGASSGVAANELWLSLGMMLALTAVYLWFSQSLFRRMLYKARVEASLGRQ